MNNTALIVIDAQESFRHRPYWVDSDVSEFVRNTQTLIDECKKRNVPVVQIFHTEEEGCICAVLGIRQDAGANQDCAGCRVSKAIPQCAGRNAACRMVE